ncbi:MAG: hypothetical protein NVSMB62_05770 [Acidobacteriaceae bacterium]
MILMFGHNPNLLETRQWVLQSRGYRVVTAEALSAFESIPRSRTVSLVLLCHSLSPEERDGAIAISRSRWPGCLHLALEADHGRAPTGILGQLLHTQDGPGQLITKVGDLLETTPEQQARAS